MTDAEIYRECLDAFPNPYYPMEKYPVHFESMKEGIALYTWKNKLGYIHLFRIHKHMAGLTVFHFRFDKKKKLHSENDFYVSPTNRYSDDYEYFLNLYQKFFLTNKDVCDKIEA